MVLNAKWRGILYLVGVIAALVVGVLVALGVITQDKAVEVIAVVEAVWVAITNALARLNLSPE